MPKKALKKGKGRTERIEVRLSRGLKQSLEDYSDRNLESIMETTNRAIKKFVGFGMDQPIKPFLSKEGDLPKDDRLEVRVHPKLKKMIVDISENIINKEGIKKPNISSIVLSAIIQHIGYSE